MTKMVSKVVLLLALLAIVVLISSEVAAKDLTQTSTTDKKAGTEVEDAKYGGGGYPGGGYGYRGGYGDRGGRYGDRGGYGGRGRYGGCGRYGCCYRGYNGCRRCCAYAGEAVETHVDNKPHN